MRNVHEKNEGNISRVSEISKIHRLRGFFLLQPTADLSLEQNLLKVPQALHDSADKSQFC